MYERCPPRNSLPLVKLAFSTQRSPGTIGRTRILPGQHGNVGYAGNAGQNGYAVVAVAPLEEGLGDMRDLTSLCQCPQYIRSDTVSQDDYGQFYVSHSVKLWGFSLDTGAYHMPGYGVKRGWKEHEASAHSTVQSCNHGNGPGGRQGNRIWTSACHRQSSLGSSPHWWAVQSLARQHGLPIPPPGGRTLSARRRQAILRFRCNGKRLS